MFLPLLPPFVLAIGADSTTLPSSEHARHQPPNALWQKERVLLVYEMAMGQVVVSKELSLAVNDPLGGVSPLSNGRGRLPSEQPECRVFFDPPLPTSDSLRFVHFWGGAQ